jgi:hypothetical protein
VDREILLVIVGGAVAFVSSIGTSLLGHLLERRRRREEWAHQERVRETERLIQGIDRFHSSGVQGRILLSPEGEYCFPEGTKILMPDHSQRPIEELAAGDEIAVFHEPTGTIASGQLQEVVRANATQVIELNNQLSLTASHTIFSEFGFRRVDAITIASSLRTSSGKTIELESITRKRGERTVYNLRLKDGDGFFAEGILVGTYASKEVYINRSGEAAIE